MFPTYEMLLRELESLEGDDIMEDGSHEEWNQQYE